MVQALSPGPDGADDHQTRGGARRPPYRTRCWDRGTDSRFRDRLLLTKLFNKPPALPVRLEKALPFLR